MISGRVTGLYRYPVKSMQGEHVEHLDVRPHGVDGDRTLALLDVSTGRIASAHHPGKWGRLLHCRARWDGTPSDGEIVVTLPDGRELEAGPELESALSGLLGHHVRLIRQAPENGYYEIVHPDIPDAAPQEFVARTLAAAGAVDGRTGHLRVALDAAPGSLVDVAPLHVISENSLRAMADLDPAAAEVRRYRPNMVIDFAGLRADFNESRIVGRGLLAGNAELQATMPTPRCIVPTLDQNEVPASSAALAIPSQHNRLTVSGSRWACLGFYARATVTAQVAIGQDVSVGE